MENKWESGDPMRDSEADIQLSKGWAVNKFISHWMPMPCPPEPPKGKEK